MLDVDRDLFMDHGKPAVQGADQQHQHRQCPGRSGVSGRSGRPTKGDDGASGEEGCCDETGRQDPEMRGLIDHRTAVPVLFDDHGRHGDGKDQAG